MNVLTLLTCFLFQPQIRTYTLDFDQSLFSNDQRLAASFKMDEDTLYIDGYSKVHMFTHTGEFKASYTLPPGFIVANFTPIPNHETVLISAKKRESDGSFSEKRMFFVGKEGQEMGIGIDWAQNQPDQVYFRSVKVTENGRIFANIYEPIDDQLEVIRQQEIALTPVENYQVGKTMVDGFLIHYVGRPFQVEHVKPKSLRTAFKNEFLMTNPKDKSLFSIGQLDRHLSVHQRDRNQIMKFKSEIPLEIPSYQSPKKPKAGQSEQAWLNSFTLITGLFHTTHGFVLTYESPSAEKKTREQHYRVYDSYGRALSPEIRLLNKKVFGVQGDQMFLFVEGETGNHKLEIHDINSTKNRVRSNRIQ